MSTAAGGPRQTPIFGTDSGHQVTETGLQYLLLCDVSNFGSKHWPGLINYTRAF